MLGLLLKTNIWKKVHYYYHNELGMIIATLRSALSETA